MEKDRFIKERMKEKVGWLIGKTENDKDRKKK